MEWLLTMTRPDIAFTTGMLGCFSGNPNSTHLVTAKCIFCYIRGTLDHKIVYSREHKSPNLYSFCDSDQAGDQTTSHLLTDFVKTKPTLIMGDNDSSILLSKHPTNHSRMKHIHVHYHFTREKLFYKTILLRWIPTRAMIGELFTKPMKGPSQRIFTYSVGLCRVPR